MSQWLKPSFQHIPHLQGLILADSTEILFEYLTKDYSGKLPQNVKSVAKSILPILFGLYQTEYSLRVNDSIYPTLVTHCSKNLIKGSQYEAITFSHLLSMHHIWDWDETNLHLELFFRHPQPISYLLNYPFIFENDSTFNYCTPASHLSAFLLEKISGLPISTVAQRHLGNPLDISLERWGRNPQGIAWGGTDLHLTLREMVSLGQWLLKEYSHPNLLPQDWITPCWSVITHVDDPYFESFVPGLKGYGYGWWISEIAQQPMYAALGYGGQFILIFPESNRLITGTSLMNASHPGNVRQFQLIMEAVRGIMD